MAECEQLSSQGTRGRSKCSSNVAGKNELSYAPFTKLMGPSGTFGFRHQVGFFTRNFAKSLSGIYLGFSEITFISLSFQ
jgi:hypothetical protein